MYANPAPIRSTRRLSGWASESSFNESTGNTQGMRFSSTPPASASTSVNHKDDDDDDADADDDEDGDAVVSELAGTVGAVVALAGAMAGAAPATGAPVGQGPAMSKRTWMPGAAPSTSTAAIADGLSLRWAESGTRADQRLPCQDCTTGAAGSITPPVSGKKASVLPASSACKPSTSTRSACPSTRPFAVACARSFGTRASAAENRSA